MNYIDFDIVLLPSKDLAKRAYTTSRGLAPFGTHFTLDEYRIIPHVSLYMFRMRDTKLGHVEQALQEIAGALPATDLAAGTYSLVFGYLDAEYSNTGLLGQLQLEVLNRVTRLRDGLRPKEVSRMAEATGLARQNYEHYGYRYAGELFRPHLTLTRFTGDTTFEDVSHSLPPPTFFSGRYDQLAICQLGDNGTCSREIAAYSLKSS